MRLAIVYHLSAQLPVVFENEHSVDWAEIHALKKAPFWGGTVRRIGPRRRGRSWSWIKIFTPYESRARALHVGMLIVLWECLEQNLQAFEHFSARKYVRFWIDLILDSDLLSGFFATLQKSGYQRPWSIFFYFGSWKVSWRLAYQMRDSCQLSMKSSFLPPAKFFLVRRHEKQKKLLWRSFFAFFCFLFRLSLCFSFLSIVRHARLYNQQVLHQTTQNQKVTKMFSSWVGKDSRGLGAVAPSENLYFQTR